MLGSQWDLSPHGPGSIPGGRRLWALEGALPQISASCFCRQIISGMRGL